MVVEVEKPFCQGTYPFEGDDPLVLTGYKVYGHIGNYIVGLFLEETLSNTRKACKKASEYM